MAATSAAVHGPPSPIAPATWLSIVDWHRLLSLQLMHVLDGSGALLRQRERDVFDADEPDHVSVAAGDREVPYVLGSHHINAILQRVSRRSHNQRWGHGRDVVHERVPAEREGWSGGV